jgi:Skp family chaperone for outer membrane proteins
MRSVVVVLGAFSLVLMLSAGPAFAQAPPQTPAPAAPPAQPAPAPAPQPPAAFPQGAKIAIVNLQQIAQLSNEGKASTARVQALITKKQAEAAAKAKQLQDNQNKLAQGGTLLNDAARGQLEKEIEKLQVEADRFQQDAQAEITELQTELQGDFQQKLFPILNDMVKEKGLHILLSAADSGVIAIEPGIDLTAEAIKRFDTATGAKPPATGAKPAAPPATPAAPATKP